MKDLDERLNYLFEEARNQSPQVSFAEVSSRFNETFGVGHGSFSQPWIGKLFFVVGALTLASLLILSLKEDANGNYRTNTQISHPLPVDNEKTFAIHQLETEILVGNEVEMLPPVEEEEQLISSVNQNSPGGPMANELIMTENGTNRPLINNQAPMIIRTKPNGQSNTNPHFNSPIPPSNAQRLVIVTEMTTMEELEKIQAMAREAGVDFHFHVRHHFHVHKDNDPRNPPIPLIRDLRGYLAIEGSETFEAYKVRVPKRGKFKLNFGWYLNSKGKALKLVDFLVEKDDQTKHPKD